MFLPNFSIFRRSESKAVIFCFFDVFISDTRLLLASGVKRKYTIQVTTREVFAEDPQTM